MTTEQQGESRDYDPIKDLTLQNEDRGPHPHDLIHTAWEVIANASDWNTNPDGEWVRAAERWRSRYHSRLRQLSPPREED